MHKASEAAAEAAVAASADGQNLSKHQQPDICLFAKLLKC